MSITGGPEQKHGSVHVGEGGGQSCTVQQMACVAWSLSINLVFRKERKDQGTVRVDVESRCV